jgi:hypothetical protein
MFPALFNQRVFEDIISPNGSFNQFFEVKLKQESECNNYLDLIKYYSSDPLRGEGGRVSRIIDISVPGQLGTDLDKSGLNWTD